MTFSPCIECGEPADGSRCTDHQLQPTPKRPTEARGYDTTWRKLSERARRLQPWCSDCFTTEDLTADHSERAWERKAAGKPIRLRDVDVVCRSCNSLRGRARPTGEDPRDHAPDPRWQAESRTLSTSRDREAS